MIIHLKSGKARAVGKKGTLKSGPGCPPSRCPRMRKLVFAPHGGDGAIREAWGARVRHVGP